MARNSTIFSSAVMPRQKSRTTLQETKGGPRSADELLKQIDEITKRNKGGFTAIGSETSSNIPFRLAGRAVSPGAELGAIPEENNPDAPVASTFKMPDLPESAPQQEEGFGNFEGNPTIDDFLQQFEQSVYRPQQAGTDQLDAAFRSTGRAYGIASMPDGGTLYNNNLIYYPDGTYREYTGKQAYGIQSLRDGGIKYSDGSIRRPASAEQLQSLQSGKQPQGIASLPGNRVLYDDGVVRYGNYLYDTVPGQSEGGLQGLIRGIFDRDQVVTQDYGNINPMEPTRGHVNLGTDIRTRDLPNRVYRLPVDAEVVGVLYDDGTRFGDQSGHAGYGNSILVRLSSGEMLRFSHMGSMKNVKEGDIIKAGDVFGTPGTTGNTAGEHLDLEYYNANGQIDNPKNFSGFTNPANFAQSREGQPTPGSIADTSDLPGNYANMSRQPNMSTNNGPQPGQQPQQPQIETPVTDAITGAIDAVKKPFEEVNRAVQPMSQERQQAGAAINQAGKGLANMGVGKSLGNSPEGFLGLGELAAGDRQAAGAEIAETGKRIGAPEVYASEVASGKMNLGEAARYNIEQNLPKTRIDTGFSELLGGDLPGAARNAGDTARRILNRAGALPGQVAQEVGQKLVPQAMASGGMEAPKISPLGDNLAGAAQSVGRYTQEKVQSGKNIFSNALQKAQQGAETVGQGVETLKKDFQGGVQKIADSVNLENLTGKRKIGDDSAGAINELTPSAGQFSTPKNDVRDPFFKLGGTDQYKSFLKPGVDANYQGGLSLDLFSPDFFKDAGNIANVFGAHHEVGKATDKYIDFEKAKYPKMSRMGYSDEYDPGSIDDYNREVDKYNSEIDKYIGSIKPFTTDTPTYAGSATLRQGVAAPGVNRAPDVSKANNNIVQNLFSKAVSGVKNAFNPNAPSVALRSVQPISTFSSIFKAAGPSKRVVASSSAPNMSVARPTASAPKPAASVSRPSTSSANMSVAPNRSVAPAPNRSVAPAPKPAPAPAPRPAPAPAPRPAPAPAPRPAPAPAAKNSGQQSKPSSNIFTKAVNAILSIFRR